MQGGVIVGMCDLGMHINRFHKLSRLYICEKLFLHTVIATFLSKLFLHLQEGRFYI